MKALPLLQSLPARVQERIQNSTDYLKSKRALLHEFESIYHLVDAMKTPEEVAQASPEERKRQKAIQAAAYHLNVIGNEVLRQLWAKEFLLGSAVVEELLYECVRDPQTSDPIRRMLQAIRKSGAHRPGVVVYPLHSLGIAGAGLLQAFTGNQTSARVTLAEAGIVVSPQTNSLSGTISYLKDALDALGVKQELPVALIEHNRRTRPTKWLERNPLLVLRVRSFTGSYYQNQLPLTIKLRFATALLYMLAVLERPYVKGVHDWASSSSVNNWQTLDIHHYLLLEAGLYPRRMQCLCVPINSDAITLAELSDVTATLHPRFWPRLKSTLPSLISTFASLEKGYVEARFGNGPDSPLSRLHTKLFDSLGYFCRSFSRFRRNHENTVQAAIAFETLLTDSYATPVAEHISQRLKLALRGVPKSSILIQSVRDLYIARSKIVHEGATKISVDMEAVQMAFVKAFLAVSGHIDGLPENCNTPVGTLLGVTKTRHRLRVVLEPKLTKSVEDIAATEGILPVAIVEQAVSAFVRARRGAPEKARPGK